MPYLDGLSRQMRDVAQGLVNDGVLAMLVDDEWTILDLGGCDAVSETAFLNTLRSAPRLRALDVSLCVFSAASLRQLPLLCPQLQVLRLGARLGHMHSAYIVLSSILPMLHTPIKW